MSSNLIREFFGIGSLGVRQYGDRKVRVGKERQVASKPFDPSSVTNGRVIVQLSEKHPETVGGCFAVIQLAHHIHDGRLQPRLFQLLPDRVERIAQRNPGINRNGQLAAKDSQITHLYLGGLEGLPFALLLRCHLLRLWSRASLFVFDGADRLVPCLSRLCMYN